MDEEERVPRWLRLSSDDAAAAAAAADCLASTVIVGFCWTGRNASVLLMKPAIAARRKVVLRIMMAKQSKPRKSDHVFVVTRRFIYVVRSDSEVGESYSRERNASFFRVGRSTTKVKDSDLFYTPPWRLENFQEQAKQSIPSRDSRQQPATYHHPVSALAIARNLNISSSLA